MPGPSWYPLIGLEIPGLPHTGRSDIRSRVVVYTYSAVYRSVRCSDFYGLREHTSEKWMKWMSLLSQLRQPEVDLIGVSPETVRKHLVQRDSSRGSPFPPPIGGEINFRTSLVIGPSANLETEMIRSINSDSIVQRLECPVNRFPKSIVGARARTIKVSNNRSYSWNVTYLPIN